jgi:hypothetical protein
VRGAWLCAQVVLSMRILFRTCALFGPTLECDIYSAVRIRLLESWHFTGRGPWTCSHLPREFEAVAAGLSRTDKQSVYGDLLFSFRACRVERVERAHALF